MSLFKIDIRNMEDFQLWLGMDRLLLLQRPRRDRLVLQSGLAT